LLLAVLDEISGFASEIGTGNDQGKTADNIYRAFRASVDSRFPDLGKVVLLLSKISRRLYFRKI
jgi:hypothetical protein